LLEDLIASDSHIQVEAEAHLLAYINQLAIRYTSNGACIVFPFFRNTSIPSEQVAQRLLANRDVIARHDLHIVFVVSREMFEAFYPNYFDFPSSANFAYLFHDQLAQVDKDLAPNQVTPHEVAEYKEAQADLAEYISQADKADEILMKKYFQTAYKAYKVSRIHEALALYQNSLILAQQLEDNYYTSSILGHIGLIYSDKGELEEALKYLQEAYQMATQLGLKSLAAKWQRFFSAIQYQVSKHHP